MSHPSQAEDSLLLSKEFQRLNDSLQRRIGTLNCGHSASPIIMGIHEPQYTPEELEKFREDNEKGITYNGKHYTMYEATQRQRLLERKIRKVKRRILVDEKLGDTEQLSIDRTKYVVMNDEYRRFSKAAGLRVRHERMEMTGFGPKQHGAAKSLFDQSKIDNVAAAFVPTKEYRTPSGDFDLEAAKKDYDDFLTTVPEKNKIYLKQSFESVEYCRKRLKTSPFGYSASNDMIYYDPDHPSFWRMDFTAANTHELAHRIDTFFANSHNDSAFCDAIAKARKTYDANPSLFIRYSNQKDDQGFISDIFSALSDGDIRLLAGHSAEYWSRPGSKEKETFANLFSLEAFRDDEKMDFIRTNFPELFSAYQQLQY